MKSQVSEPKVRRYNQPQMFSSWEIKIAAFPKEILHWSCPHSRVHNPYLAQEAKVDLFLGDISFVNSALAMCISHIFYPIIFFYLLSPILQTERLKQAKV